MHHRYFQSQKAPPSKGGTSFKIQSLMYKDQGNIHSYNQHALRMPQFVLICGPLAKEREHQNGNRTKTNERELQLPSLIVKGQLEEYMLQQNQKIEFASVSEGDLLR